MIKLIGNVVSFLLILLILCIATGVGWVNWRAALPGGRAGGAAGYARVLTTRHEDSAHPDPALKNSRAASALAALPRTAALGDASRAGAAVARRGLERAPLRQSA